MVASPRQPADTDAAGALRWDSTDGCTLVWLDGIAARPATEWFEPPWLERHGCLDGEASGRGTTHFVRLHGYTMVLRHYRRGGLFGDLLQDRYFWGGLRNTRPWRELVVQAALYARGLPVPQPLAARIQRPSWAALLYRADLLTERLCGASTLAQRAAQGRPDAHLWGEVGRVIARFHAAGLEHADLNAHNILIAMDGRVHLIDFDRARLHGGPGRWAPRNLVRLRRSLDKLQHAGVAVHFDDDAWESLTAGYEAARRR